MDRELEIDKLRAIRISLIDALGKCNEILEDSYIPLGKRSIRLFDLTKPYKCCNPRYVVQDVRLSTPNVRYVYQGYVRYLGQSAYVIGHWDAYGREVPEVNHSTGGWDIINVEENSDGC